MGLIRTIKPTPTTDIGYRIVALGDSITQADSDIPNNSFGPISWFMQLIVRSDGRLKYVRNSAISGNTTSMMLSRLQQDVIAYKPDICIILGGTNDINLNIAPSKTIANIKEILNALKTAGITPVLCTIPPRGDNLKDDALTTNNLLIRDLAFTSRATLLDLYSVLVDPATGRYKAGLNADNLHLNYTGAKVVSEYVKDVLLSQIPDVRVAVPHVNSSATNLVSNGLFIADSNADGVPDGWITYGSGGVTTSITEKKGILGKALKLSAASNNGGNRYVEQSINISTGKFSAGDKIAICGRFISEMATDGDVLFGAGLKFSGANSGIVPIKDWKLAINPGTFYHEITVPAGTTSLVINMSVGNGTGDVYFGQIGLYNLTKLGIEGR